jgi:protein-disulfide isomerase
VLIVVAAISTIEVGAQVPDTAAEVNGVAITTTEVDAKLGNNLAQLQEQIYSMRQKQLEMMIDQKLLENESAKRGVTIAALVEAEITSRVNEATSADAEKFYKDNKNSLQGDFKTIGEQIRNFLTAQRVQARQQEFMKTLRSGVKIDVLLKRPPIFRSEVSVEGAPIRGEASAPVTIVEFSDFHCPFCRKTQPVLDELRARYGAKIKLVYRDFPLDSLHPQARAAAEASHCAMDQGKFWEFHDRLFKIDDASQAALSRIAKETGLDFATFETCRSSGKYKNVVQVSTLEGARLGLSATPTFFINGRLLVGAQPIEAFVTIIEEELALRQSSEQR